MPNGYHTPEEEQEFQRLDQALRVLDPTLKAFARKIGAKLTVNYHGSASRQLLHEDRHRVQRQLGIYSITHAAPDRRLKTPHFMLAIAAYRDDARGRSLWGEQLMSDPDPLRLMEHLDGAWGRLWRVRVRDLRRVDPPPRM